MRTRFVGIAGLSLGLALLGGVAATSAHSGSLAPLSYSAASSHLVGAGLSAPLFQVATSVDPACAAQDQTGAAETGATTGPDTDTVDLQCGDQTGADTGASGDQTGAETLNAESGAANGPDQDTVQSGDSSSSDTGQSGQ